VELELHDSLRISDSKEKAAEVFFNLGRSLLQPINPSTPDTPPDSHTQGSQQ